MRPSAVVFDAFGTLISPVRSLPYRRLAKLSHDASAFRREALTANVPIEELARTHGAGEFAEELRAALAGEASACTLMPGAGQVLARLASEGIPYAICSNLAHGYGPAVRRLVPGASAYVFSYEVRVAKPDAAIYAAACGALGMGPSRLLFVGDTLDCDFDGPASYGMAATLVSRHPGRDLAAVTLAMLGLQA